MGHELCIDSSEVACLSKHLSRLEPSEEQKERISRLVDRAVRELHHVVEESGLKPLVREISIHGSFARDTWLPEDTDVDVFVLFDESLGLEELHKSVETLSTELAQRLGAELEVRFASHPYFIIKYRGVELELVPAYKVESPQRIKSAVDRTPFHTEYIISQISRNPALKRDIRLFKALLRRLNIYGAEIEVKGFSGYLAEVLIVHYGGLIPLLCAASKWIPWRVVIPETAYRLRGTAPLVVLDPVDPRRNAAAAVGVDQLSKLILFANVFKHCPAILCCVLEGVEEETEYAPDENSIVLQLVKHPTLAPDALAGKLNRVLDAVTNTLRRNGFSVLRKLHLKLNEKHLLVLQLESLELPLWEKKVGPPVWHENVLRFLEKWASNKPAPFIEGDRVVAVAPRKNRNAIEIIKEVLKVYKGFEWEISKACDYIQKLPMPEKRELLKRLAGYEPWILCLKRFMAGAEL